MSEKDLGDTVESMDEGMDESSGTETDTESVTASGSSSPSSEQVSESTPVPDSTSDAVLRKPAPAQAATAQPAGSSGGAQYKSALAKENPHLANLLAGNRPDPNANAGFREAMNVQMPGRAEGSKPGSPSRGAKRTTSDDESRPDADPTSPTKKLKSPAKDSEGKK